MVLMQTAHGHHLLRFLFQKGECNKLTVECVLLGIAEWAAVRNEFAHFTMNDIMYNWKA